MVDHLNRIRISLCNLARIRDTDLSVLHHFEVGNLVLLVLENLVVLLWIVLGSGGSVNRNGSIIIVDGRSRNTNVFIHLIHVIILIVFRTDLVVGGGRGGGRLVHVRVEHVGIDDDVQIRATFFTLYRVVDPRVRVYENRGTILVVSYHRSLRFLVR